MSDLSRRKISLAGVGIAALSLACAVSFATQCGVNDIEEPIVTAGNPDGRHIACPADTADLNRIYGALILYRQNEEIPLYEGTTYDPFDGMTLDFTVGDGYEDGDKFFMRAICSQQYDSEMRTRYTTATTNAADLQVERAALETKLPKEVRKAFRAVRKAYRNSIPRPEVYSYAPGTPNRVRISLDSWNAPNVEFDDDGVELIEGETRAALKRKALGHLDSDPTEQQNNPEVPGRENWLSDDLDNGTARVKVPKTNGSTAEIVFKTPQRHTVLYGNTSDVFGKTGTDNVIRGRRYRYYTEVFFTIAYKGKKYRGGLRGKKRLRLRAMENHVQATKYEPVQPDENDPDYDVNP